MAPVESAKGIPAWSSTSVQTTASVPPSCTASPTFTASMIAALWSIGESAFDRPPPNATHDHPIASLSILATCPPLVLFTVITCLDMLGCPCTMSRNASMIPPWAAIWGKHAGSDFSRRSTGKTSNHHAVVAMARGHGKRKKYVCWSRS